MSNLRSFAIALGSVGALLAASPASFAQEGWRMIYPPRVVYIDRYYDYPPVYAGAAYVRGPMAYDAYAAVPLYQNGYDAYAATSRWYSPVLRGGDWVAVHGATR